ncbi:Cupin domain-containing protein [Rhodovastum atsumiense]|uniref:Cupin domain-containing protein n=1 Tax=Rhodovastum atsumiense TaxID=504468 RepID=A0A5M6ILX4_9PROT|nr:dimethylsulfonioproprionate lyase family protein [Rhodovastum atsumiense]KAA5608565.1 cupin domain-containing protein [Rhodovastum atsumiense]CAH2598796.1 Cupin domain-containing protein [Rhodovastum atsumiense]
MSIPEQIATLVTLLRQRLALRRNLPDAIGREVARAVTALEAVNGTASGLALSFHPVLRHLPACLQATDKGLAEALAPLADHLPWHYGYPPRRDAPDLGRDIAFAELVGPAAPLHSDEVCLGLTLIGPHSFYPLHAHPAAELYWVLSGAAAWTAGQVTQVHPPGSYILHPPNLPHAMRTGAVPLLAAYTWTGEVAISSVYVEAPPA